MTPISKETAEHYKWGEDCDGWFLVNEADRSVIHERMPPGTAEVKHYHVKAKQFFFMLAGTATMELNGQMLELGPGQGVAVEPGVPHQIRNDSEADTEFLVISNPATKGDRITV
ncbi:cupin domain-containing protein [Paenibacillus filicis]|uniref:Cupin domain-containing protein n=1 Tax=Paenibacillus filicis TaxID=669464 RepID=A0ABU9DGS4_9BACL